MTPTSEPRAEVIDEDELLEEAAAPKVESPYDRPGQWYVLHTQSGYENKVRQNLEARTRSMNMEERIHEIVIPLEDVVEIRNGKKVVVQKKMFPGYLLVRCKPRRRQLVRDPQHPRGHRVRRRRQQAVAAAAQGRRDLPRR